MKILLIGSGGREHALAWKLRQSPRVKELIAAPGNPGIASLGRCEAVAVDQIPELVALARRERVDLVVVGPEVPLVAGLADRLLAEKIPVFGPRQQGALLEGSKAFTKAFLREFQIPTAHYEAFADFDKAVDFLQTQAYPIVLKADGLAAGKGVLICQDRAQAVAGLEQILKKRVFGTAGDCVVIEEFLEGEEVSFQALVDGEDFLPLAASQDYKRVGEGDTGENTGGMGATSPVSSFTPALERRVIDEILRPTLAGFKRRGIEFKGVLYTGLMLTSQGPKVLEFNVRFGDPETQVLMARMQSDLVDLIEATTQGRLAGQPVRWHPGSAVVVVLAAGGYPGPVRKGDVISGVEEAGRVPGTQVFHAGTKLQGSSHMTSGGRVLGVTSLGKDIQEARMRVYEACAKISWQGMHYRRDIGWRELQAPPFEKGGLRGIF